MSYRIKIPPRTLPVDEAHLVSGLERFVLRLQDYRIPLLVGFGVLVLAVAVVAGVLWFDHQTTQKADELLRDATRHYFTRPIDDPKKADANLKQAIALYRQVVDQYPRTAVAPLALYHLGNALVQANDLDGAIEAYKRFVLLYGSNPTMLGLVQQRLGYVYLLKGDRDQGAKSFSAVLEVPGALNRDHVLFELAKLEESLSRPEGALAHYQDLIKNYPNSPLASEAGIRTKILEGKKTPGAPAPGGSNPTGTAESPPASTSPKNK